MDHYQDITLIPDAEANLGFLWQKVFHQVHLAIVEHKVDENQSAIALSIPKYKHSKKGDKGFALGNQIRLVGSQPDLEKINIGRGLSRLMDYVHIKSIQPVPTHVNQYACFKRKHVIGAVGAEKKIERKAKYIAGKFSGDYGAVLKQLLKPNSADPADSTPYIRVARKKTGEPFANSFPLFISMERMDAPLIGEFNCYGLSSLESGKLATVPWF
jgi:CRISPR-associated endonuclease Csy4